MGGRCRIDYSGLQCWRSPGRIGRIVVLSACLPRTPLPYVLVFLSCCLNSMYKDLTASLPQTDSSNVRNAFPASLSSSSFVLYLDTVFPQQVPELQGLLIGPQVLRWPKRACIVGYVVRAEERIDILRQGVIEQRRTPGRSLGGALRQDGRNKNSS